jgi:pSer/pThr/pTyr-binding forkhead associated (FHA) protein
MMMPTAIQLETPYTIVLIFADSPLVLQFEIFDEAILGRRSEANEQPDIDLAPFGGFPAGVSRLHARLIRTSEGLQVEDLGSTKGTFAQEDRVLRGQRVDLEDGQRLQLGYLKCWVYFTVPDQEVSA